MSLDAICTNRPSFSRDKYCSEHCFHCPGLGTCVQGACMHCRVCDNHTYMGRYSSETICQTCGEGENHYGEIVSSSPEHTLDLANRKKIMFLVKDMTFAEPYLETIIESHRELYEKIMLYQLADTAKKLNFSYSNMDIYSTFDEFKEYLNEDMTHMMSVIGARFTAFEAVIDKVQGKPNISP